MRPEELRQRLSRINHAPSSRPACGSGRHVAGRAVNRDNRPEATLPQGHEVSTDSGRHWLVRRTLEDVWPSGPHLVRRGQERLRCQTPDLRPVHAEVQAFRQGFPEQTVFLDLETCGFAGSMIFLVGLLHSSGSRYFLSQLLARNYAEEKGVLRSLWQLMADCRVLVTFNGKSFDWPQVVDRSTLHRVSTRATGAESRHSMERPVHDGNHGATTESEMAHFDLLHHARRVWRGQLPDCKLQTLERYVCGRRRTGDIPGSDIPRAYHEFVRTSRSTSMQSILHHNALDLITLLQLSVRIARGCEEEPSVKMTND